MDTWGAPSPDFSTTVLSRITNPPLDCPRLLAILPYGVVYFSHLSILGVPCQSQRHRCLPRPSPLGPIWPRPLEPPSPSKSGHIALLDRATSMRPTTRPFWRGRESAAPFVRTSKGSTRGRIQNNVALPARSGALLPLASSMMQRRPPREGRLVTSTAALCEIFSATRMGSAHTASAQSSTAA